MNFTPKDLKGDFIVEFKNIDLTKYAGKSLVVTQKVYNKNGVLVGNHNDLNDKNQTVTVRNAVKVNTGVKSYMVLASLGVLALIGLGLGFFIKSRYYR